MPRSALLLVSALLSGCVANKGSEVVCEGSYPRHLQGLCAEGASVYWSWTDALVRTDLSGRLLASTPAPFHQGDLCQVGGKVYVAVNLGQFNRPAGKADNWIHVHDAATLRPLSRHPAPEVVHGAGGIAHRDGRFFVVGGLPPDVPENYVYEYDAELRFVRRHVLASGNTLMGIQTVAWAHGSWWFGCYGEPKVLLRADTDFRITGRWHFDASLGVEEGPEGSLLIGSNGRAADKSHLGRMRKVRIADLGPSL
ncbi:MAG: hypothetical protein ACKOIB_05190 [Verrucomicrobiota bacterium]